MQSPYKLNTMRYRANRTRFKWNHKSKQYSLIKVSNTVLRDQRAYQNSLTDRMTPWSVQWPLNGLDSTNLALSVLGSDHPITSKNQSRSIRGTHGCHITSRDVRFKTEILHHGRDIFRAQFEQDQPPGYALTYLSLELSLELRLESYLDIIIWFMFVIHIGILRKTMLETIPELTIGTLLRIMFHDILEIILEL